MSAQPGGFLAVAVLLTIAVLVLARQSQSLVSDTDTGPDEQVSDAAPVDPGIQADEPVGAEPADPRRATGQPPLSASELTTGMLFANVLVTQGAAAAILVVAAWYFAIPADALGLSLGLGPGQGRLALGGVAFGAVLWLLNELATTLADAVGAAYDEALRGLLAPSSAGGWLVLYLVVLPIIAISEELLFRAALIGVPAASYGVPAVALAVVASVAFALGHGAQGRVGVVVTGALGLVLAAGYVVSGSLLLVVVAHYVVNGLEFLVHEQLGIDSVFGAVAPSP